jgi:hypothetical protein
MSIRPVVEVALALLAAIIATWIQSRNPALLGSLRQRLVRIPVSLAIMAAAVIPVTVRLAVLPWQPVPVPEISDEFSHILVADTLAHGRLANPPHPLSTHLETLYVLQDPTYASIYPLSNWAGPANGSGNTAL